MKRGVEVRDRRGDPSSQHHPSSPLFLSVSVVNLPSRGLASWRHDGFTLTELLVTLALLLSLALMATGVYYNYLKDAEDDVLRNNLTVMRAALQQFYADNGRYPYDGIGPYGNETSFLDPATSELTNGPYTPFRDRDHPLYEPSAGRDFVRYLVDIPIDPTTNARDWTLLTSRVIFVPGEGSAAGSSQKALTVVTGVRSSNPIHAHL